MRGALSVGSTFGLLVYLVVMMGAIQGAHLGYNATNQSAATVQYNGTHVTMGTQPPENVTLNFSSDEPVDGPFANASESIASNHERDSGTHPAVKSVARETTHVLFHIGFGTADFVAGVVYHNQWLPKPVLNGLFEAMSYGMVLGVVVLQLARVRRVL
jgi:hypothetical protein